MISRQLVFDDGGVPVPVGPVVTRRALDPRDGDLRRRGVALGVVPHEQHPVLLEGGPRRGAGQPRRPLAVGHLLASAVAAPPPVVERTGDLVALHLTLAEVPAHVAAVAVEHVDLAVAAAEHHQLLAEGVHRVRFAVAEVPGQPQAVPAAGESGRRCCGFDLPNSSSVSEVSDCNVMTSFYSRDTACGADRPAGRENSAAATVRPTYCRSRDDCSTGHHPRRPAPARYHRRSARRGFGHGYGRRAGGRRARIDRADRREIAVRRRLDREVRRSAVVPCEPCARGERRRGHRDEGA